MESQLYSRNVLESFSFVLKLSAHPLTIPKETGVRYSVLIFMLFRSSGTSVFFLENLIGMIRAF
jgi:hypothetical protein